MITIDHDSALYQDLNTGSTQLYVMSESSAIGYQNSRKILISCLAISKFLDCLKSSLQIVIPIFSSNPRLVRHGL